MSWLEVQIWHLIPLQLKRGELPFFRFGRNEGVVDAIVEQIRRLPEYLKKQSEN